MPDNACPNWFEGHGAEGQKSAVHGGPAIRTMNLCDCVESAICHREEPERVWSNEHACPFVSVEQQAMDPGDAKRVFSAALRAVDPADLVRRNCRIDGEGLWIGETLLERGGNGRLVIAGAGKAAGRMCSGLLEAAHAAGIAGHRLVGQVNVPEGETLLSGPVQISACRSRGENLPGERVVRATQRIVTLLRHLESDDLGVCLISGGGSALLALPAEGITLDEKCRLIRWLDHSGADITVRNRIRRELSQVKGGRLAVMAGGKRLVTLVISDICGDPLDLVASGPTVAVPPRPDEALALIDQYSDGDPEKAGVPPRILEFLRSQVAAAKALESGSDAGETPRPAGCDRSSLILAGNLQLAVDAAAEYGAGLGYQVGKRVQKDLGETVDQASTRIAVWIQQQWRNPDDSPRLLVDAGEPVLQVGSDSGRGGRNQHLVLEVAVKLLLAKRGGLPRFAVLSGGTDGEDGNTLAAGGLIDSEWLDCNASRLPEMQAALRAFDSHSFLRTTGGLLETGPTGTNVGDIRIMVTGD